MKLMDDQHYIEIYAEKMKENKNLFKQHKKFIESQLNGSEALFRKMFGKDFKLNARKYLRSIKLLKSPTSQ